MDELNKNNKCNEICIGGGVEWYREKIIDMIQQTNDLWILEVIHRFVKNMIKEGD